MLSYKDSNYRRRNWGASSGARGGFRQGSASHVLPPVSDKPFGPEIDRIEISNLLIEENAPIIENVNYVASYNWVDGKNPIILVPGRQNIILTIEKGRHQEASADLQHAFSTVHELNLSVPNG